MSRRTKIAGKKYFSTHCNYLIFNYFFSTLNRWILGVLQKMDGACCSIRLSFLAVMKHGLPLPPIRYHLFLSKVLLATSGWVLPSLPM
jgi:hypothetical protein